MITSKQQLYTIISTKKAVYEAYEKHYLNIKNDIMVEYRPKRTSGTMYGDIGGDIFISKYHLTTDYVICWCRKLFRIY